MCVKISVYIRCDLEPGIVCVKSWIIFIDRKWTVNGLNGFARSRYGAVHPVLPGHGPQNESA